jgi:hypothetical protein
MQLTLLKEEQPRFTNVTHQNTAHYAHYTNFVNYRTCLTETVKGKAPFICMFSLVGGTNMVAAKENNTKGERVLFSNKHILV